MEENCITSAVRSAAPRFGVRNMRVDEETPYSLRVSWQPVDARNVRHYRLGYASVGERAVEASVIVWMV